MFPYLAIKCTVPLNSNVSSHRVDMMYDKPISVEQNAKYIEVEGIPVSGRTWKDKALPIRTKMMIKNSKKKWLEQQQMQRHMKLVSLEAKQLIENRKEEIRLKRQRRLEKQSKKVENEIRAAGPNAIVLSNSKSRIT